MITSILDLLEDENHRYEINGCSKKIKKGYNGHLYEIIRLIHDLKQNNVRLFDFLESNNEFQNFLNLKFKKYSEKLGFELGGFHPRTKNENNGFRNLESPAQSPLKSYNNFNFDDYYEDFGYMVPMNVENQFEEIETVYLDDEETKSVKINNNEVVKEEKAAAEMMNNFHINRPYDDGEYEFYEFSE